MQNEPDFGDARQFDVKLPAVLTLRAGSGVVLPTQASQAVICCRETGRKVQILEIWEKADISNSLSIKTLWFWEFWQISQIKAFLTVSLGGFLI